MAWALHLPGRMKLARLLSVVLALGFLGCGGVEPAASPGDPAPVEPLAAGTARHPVLAFVAPRQGPSITVSSAGCPASSTLLAATRTLQFPDGATDRAISSTAKSICFRLQGTYHCHTSGTSTGFCDDWDDNLGNAMEWGKLQSIDGDFLEAYLAPRIQQQPRPRVNVSGHSQGGADAAQVAGLLDNGDQLTLLQPAASALYMKDALHQALARGAVVSIAWTTGDEASIGIRPINAVAKLPLIEMPQNVPGPAEQCGVRLHNAPNARSTFLDMMHVPAGYTTNPALDASIISNPGSPCSEWGNMKLDCPAQVPWSCPSWSS